MMNHWEGALYFGLYYFLVHYVVYRYLNNQLETAILVGIGAIEAYALYRLYAVWSEAEAELHRYAVYRNIKDKTARSWLTMKGFDPDDLNMVCEFGLTPLTYFSYKGNVTMVQYLIAHGADCRTTDRGGWFPLYAAALSGHLEIMKLLSRDGGAHEDIRRQTKWGKSPLRIAFINGDVPFVQWLILNGALASGDGDGGIDDEIMRNDLRQIPGISLADDKRETVRAWARGAVTIYGIILTSTSFTFNGKQLPGVLESIAHYVSGTPQQLRTLRQLIHRLSAFIAEVPFVEEEEEEEGEDE